MAAATTATICLAAASVLALAASAASASEVDSDEFPLLMPKVRPGHKEDYLCTPVRVAEDRSGYVVGFRPNSSQHIAHHMLVYGCEEPGSDDGDVWNCGEMAAGEEDGIVHT